MKDFATNHNPNICYECYRSFLHANFISGEKSCYPLRPAVCQKWVSPGAAAGIPVDDDAERARLKGEGDRGVIVAEAPVHLAGRTCVQHCL